MEKKEKESYYLTLWNMSKDSEMWRGERTVQSEEEKLVKFKKISLASSNKSDRRKITLVLDFHGLCLKYKRKKVTGLYIVYVLNQLWLYKTLYLFLYSKG